jgi:hypothetical protein
MPRGRSEGPRLPAVRAAEEWGALATRIGTLIGEWRSRADSTRKDSAASKLIELLPSQPIVSVATAHATIGGSAEAVRLALNNLEEGGVLRQITAGRYVRAWAADDLFEIPNEYEHSLATPTRSDQRRRH